MKYIPILFNGPMVRAILEGRKTQTRRPMKIQPPTGDYELSRLVDTTGPRRNMNRLHWILIDGLKIIDGKQPFFDSPFGGIGDRLWVRETHILRGTHVIYRADVNTIEAAGLGGMYGGWHPSIHMPRWASRITLEITDVRVQRVQEISEEDAKSEGIPEERATPEDIEDILISDAAPVIKELARILGPGEICARPRFRKLWDSLYAKRGFGWDVNPLVWALTFKVVQA